MGGDFLFTFYFYIYYVEPFERVGMVIVVYVDWTFLIIVRGKIGFVYNTLDPVLMWCS